MVKDWKIFGDKFDKELLRLIARYFPDYRIWCDIYNLYSITKHRICDVYGTAYSNILDNSYMHFNSSECLVACALRVAYPRLTQEIIINGKPFDDSFEGAYSFIELVSRCYRNNPIGAEEKDEDARRMRAWEKYPFVIDCVRPLWFTSKYPIYLIDWEGGLTPGAWLIMEGFYSVKEDSSLLYDISHLPLDEADCKSAFEWYPTKIYNRLTSNISLLYWSLVMSDDLPIDPEMVEYREGRHGVIFNHIKKEFRERLKVLRNDKASNSLLISFVATRVFSNVMSVFHRLFQNGFSDLYNTLRSRLIDEIFTGFYSYVSISFIYLLPYMNLPIVRDDVKEDEFRLIDGLNQNLYAIGSYPSMFSDFERLLFIYRRLCIHNPTLYKSGLIAILEFLCSMCTFWVAKNNSIVWEGMTRENLAAKLRAYVSERVEKNHYQTNDVRNQQFQSFKERLDTGWLPGDDEAGGGDDDKQEQK